MKNFRTELKITPSARPIGFTGQVLTQGSCFSEAIGDRLTAFKVKTLVNPFGTIYNPESIHHALRCSVVNEVVPDHTFVQNEEIHVNHNFHSQLSALSREALRAQLTAVIGATHYFLKDAHWVMLTYGTAWVYQRRDTGEIVANCHKLPQENFYKTLLSPDAIVSSFKQFYDQLKRFNSGVRIILTVSPVRHLKDTLELNSVSKAVLRVASHQIAEQFDDAEYFPAYELVMDDLRDYRFYSSDMLHPTEEAEDYIWDKFVERYFSRELKDFVKEWKTVLSALRHKPFHPGTQAHQRFLKDTLRKVEALQEKVDVSNEISMIKAQIIK